MPRETMVSIITRLRRLIGDSAGPSQVWTDDELQEILDDHRDDYRDLQMTAATRRVAGEIQYLDFYAPNSLRDWESDAVITDSNGDEVAFDDDASEPLLGHWVFAESQARNLYLTGYSFDVYGAAVEVLKNWAAKEKLSFDFSSDHQSFKESQKVTALLALAKQFEKKARAGSGDWVNTEVYAHRY